MSNLFRTVTKIKSNFLSNIYYKLIFTENTHCGCLLYILNQHFDMLAHISPIYKY